MDIKRALRQRMAFQAINHRRHLWLDSEYRRNDRQPRAVFEAFCKEDGGLGLSQDVMPRGSKPKTALIVKNFYRPFAPMEAFVVKAFQMAGFRTVVVGRRSFDFLRYDQLTGTKTTLELADFDTQGDPEWVDRQMPRLTTLQDWLNLDYQHVHVGRFTIATTMRELLIGQPDFTDPATLAHLKQKLHFSVCYARGAAKLLDHIRPDCALFMDRGYSSFGELFDLCIHRGIDAITWTLGYKSDRFVFKRYNPVNVREHFLALSADSWRRVTSMKWGAAQGRKIRQELFDCYQNQDWFSFVGTQFDKQLLSAELTRQKLGLPSDRKIAVVFPHILWDGSFFYGEDLFGDYTEWFLNTIRAACENRKIHWVVKLHPAHVVKARQSNTTGKPREVELIESTFGKLPDHLTLVHPGTELSTYSLFEIADYAVTVRGTVGIEAALFGIPTVTAGTGRYDRRGFTIDSSSREEYLERLAALETYPRLSLKQIELAERFAYATFLGRPLPVSAISVSYARDGKATPKVKVNCQTREQWLESPDMRQLSDWIARGTDEDMMLLPDDDQPDRIQDVPDTRQPPSEALR